MGNGWFLANLTEDVAEQHNRMSAEPALVARLHALHTTWRAEVGLPPLGQPAP
jgi:hypothetical protein